MGLKRNAVLTCGFTDSLDTSGTLCEQSPSGAQSDPLRRVGRSVLLAIGISLFTPAYAVAPVQAKPDIQMTIREYAAVLVDDKTQMKCLGLLYGKESAWNPEAVNGSHYGIPQGRSEYLRTADKYEQVRWGLGYIEVRYGTPCKAWEFFQRNNYH